MPARTTGLQFRGSFSGLLLRDPSRGTLKGSFQAVREALRDAEMDPLRVPLRDPDML